MVETIFAIKWTSELDHCRTVYNLLSVADPDPGSSAFYPWIRDKYKSESGITTPNHISESLSNSFLG